MMPPPPPPNSSSFEKLNEKTLKTMTTAELAKVLGSLLGKKVGKKSKTALVQHILEEQEKRIS